jgi:ketosteroid isomerase-like protein
MNQRYCAVGIFAIVAGLAAPVLAADSKGDVAAIHAVDQAWLKAYTAGDADTLSKLYDEHAVLLPANHPAVRGRAAIKDYFVKDIAETSKAGVSMAFGDKSDGGASGNLGWASGTFTVKDKSGTSIATGKFLSVSKKVNGKWLYWRDTWNTDAAPAKP